MTTLFISDVHLSQHSPNTTKDFLFLLEAIKGKVDKLYILGDLFDCWLGDDDNSAYNKIIKTQLRHATQYYEIFFMVGNRDFFCQEEFFAATGLQRLIDPSVINLYDESVLLMHGDLLCTDDIIYQKARIKFHDKSFQKEILAKPLWMRRLYAKWLRFKSRRHQKDPSLIQFDANPCAIEERMNTHNVNFFIHGHTHKPSIQFYYQENQAPKQRIVLSDWHQYGNYLICDHEQRKQLVNFTQDTGIPL